MLFREYNGSNQWRKDLIIKTAEERLLTHVTPPFTYKYSHTAILNIPRKRHNHIPRNITNSELDISRGYQVFILHFI